MATEIDVGGIKFRGGKIFLILTILSSFIGVLWGGFQIYQRYLTMEEKINTYVAPDMTGFDKRIELLQVEIDMQQNELKMIL